MTVALLFPGQGAQQPGMFDRLPTSPAATALIESTLAGVACATALTEDHGLEMTFVAGHPSESSAPPSRPMP